MTEKTPDVPVTWDDLGQLASALSMLTQANLSEEVLGEIAAPLIRRMEVFGEELLREAGVAPESLSPEEVQWAVAQTAKERMQWARKGLEEVRGHLTALEDMVPAEEGGQLVVLRERVGDVQLELQTMALRKAFQPDD